ncbi:PhnD/SsuA/transferrin family substrate-binding protein [Methylibium petroleiphilum]|uniref:substrate-binding domain-containing protein n=1 Tax=Methylibium petroleiphilum TaxID=105560 RepID=UPI001ACB45D5|nr:PhnD/SsuA/transferrin family substrate-binding protein [Methylibium petroleiphilum]MBN9206188.1 PhnD/SsuA/transferrin family substrate-binding protein [Methylibium petroleiphilum]
MDRRRVLQAGLLALSSGSSRVRAQGAPARAVLRFGTTPVFLDDQVGFLARWSAYLSAAVRTPVEFVSRRSYRDIMGLLRSQELEAAWICGFPWVMNRSELRGLSTPLYRGVPLYQSYLVVPATDTSTASLADLRGKVFAYSDPDSNSGWLVPRTTLMKAGIDPDRHFARSFYTWGHRNVVNAVAAGLAQGGAVDGYVWDTLAIVAPALVARTRVAWRSERYGFPPLAVRATLDPATECLLHDALLGMTRDAEGRKLLAELNLSGFGAFDARVFDSIAKNATLAGARVT